MLPIGSIVYLVEEEEPFIITSTHYLTEDLMENLVYLDYKGYPYPSGDRDTREYMIFNEEDIEEVIFEGFDDGETEERNRAITKIYEQENIEHVSLEELVNRLEEQDRKIEELQEKNPFSKLFNNK